MSSVKAATAGNGSDRQGSTHGHDHCGVDCRTLVLAALAWFFFRPPKKMTPTEALQKPAATESAAPACILIALFAAMKSPTSQVGAEKGDDRPPVDPDKETGYFTFVAPDVSLVHPTRPSARRRRSPIQLDDEESEIAFVGLSPASVHCGGKRSPIRPGGFRLDPPLMRKIRNAIRKYAGFTVVEDDAEVVSPVPAKPAPGKTNPLRPARAGSSEEAKEGAAREGQVNLASLLDGLDHAIIGVALGEMTMGVCETVASLAEAVGRSKRPASPRHRLLIEILRLMPLFREIRDLSAWVSSSSPRTGPPWFLPEAGRHWRGRSLKHRTPRRLRRSPHLEWLDGDELPQPPDSITYSRAEGPYTSSYARTASFAICASRRAASSIRSAIESMKRHWRTLRLTAAIASSVYG